MYHIPNDKRTIRSAHNIYAGLQACLKNKSFDEITITDIQKESGVSRSTFYRLFDNLTDVIYWTCDTHFAKAFEAANEIKQKDELSLTRHFIGFWMEQSEFIELMFHVRQPYILYQCLLRNAEKARQKEALPPWSVMSEAEARYALNIRASFIFSILKTWLEGGRKESIDEVMDILLHQLSVFFAANQDQLQNSSSSKLLPEKR
ncbi:TetR/AcrR family transcriptional regulator [Erysipelotrichaceae bacterium RD49]|nr:TetR/AcrR family transcriptional regulator [Erysipelotrichaceae bacterium RD49]